MLVRSFFVLVTLLFTLSSFAQNTKLTGKIVNDRNEPLAGVSIKVEGNSQGTTTNIEGVYSLSLVPATKYTLLVTAIGFESKSISDVEVKAGETNDLSIALNVSAKSETEVIVRSVSRRQESTNALLQFQKNNTSLSSGIAADFIRRTPDRNTGEVLKRVSGTSIQDNKFVVVRGLSDRYNQAFINNAPMPSSEPDRKAFSFDLIPSQMIDNIMINKTATPDLTGEFAGGLILIRTKDVPTKNLLSVNELKH